MQQDKLLGALGLARRAGALALGADAVQDALQRGRAALALYTQDAAPGSVQRLQRLGSSTGCEVRPLPLTMEQLAGLFHKGVGVLAGTDKNLAALCRNNLHV